MTHAIRNRIELTREKIDNSALVPSTASTLTGATVAFFGTAREITGGQRTESLEYDAYVEMASACFERLANEARGKWPIEHLRIVHRLGRIELGETCVAIVVSCPHRAEAFNAAAWLMEQTKALVPIWKKENWAAGTSQWVHPKANSATVNRTSRSDIT
jgi:molybdopterin synthase catalytic subunit